MAVREHVHSGRRGARGAVPTAQDVLRGEENPGSPPGRSLGAAGHLCADVHPRRSSTRAKIVRYPCDTRAIPQAVPISAWGVTPSTKSHTHHRTHHINTTKFHLPPTPNSPLFLFIFNSSSKSSPSLHFNWYGWGSCPHVTLSHSRFVSVVWASAAIGFPVLSTDRFFYTSTPFFTKKTV